MASPRPNLLVFIPHDLGVHLGCYGHASVRSPRLDRLAAARAYRPGGPKYAAKGL